MTRLALAEVPLEPAKRSLLVLRRSALGVEVDKLEEIFKRQVRKLAGRIFGQPKRPSLNRSTEADMWGCAVTNECSHGTAQQLLPGRLPVTIGGGGERMPSHRAVVAVAGATVVLVVVVGIVIALAREDTTPANGELLAFSCKEPNNIWCAICTVKSDGTERRRITRRMQTTNPAWSPDGQRIAFTRSEDVGEYTRLSADDVFVMDADGSDLKQLTADHVGVHSGQPAWSPDGTRIAFVRGASVPTTLIVRPGSVFVMNADGSDVQRLTRGWLDARPAWSPDGREIAFSRSKRVASSSRAIWVMDADGGHLRKLTHAATSLDGAPAWSPDGARIAFVRLTRESPVNGKAALYIMNRDGSDLRELLRYQLFDFFYYGLTWSPNRKSIAFEASPNRSCVAISVIHVQTRNVHPLTSCQFPRQSTRAPVWQPDAEKRKR
jgi:hypothetical protein